MEDQQTYNGLSPERVGRITASKATDLLSKGKGEMFGAGAKTYAEELAVARLGVELPNFETYATNWGHEHEPDARMIYEDSRDVVVGIPGFIIHPEYDFIGCTPDGVVFSDDLIINNEIKCRQWKAHLQYLRFGLLKSDINQVQFQMMVIEAKYGIKTVTDFMIFNPTFPDHLQARVFRIEPDREFHKELIERAIGLNKMVNDIIKEVS